MGRNSTKTIMLIVFVVFLGCFKADDVLAKEYVCRYTGDVTATVVIGEGLGTPTDVEVTVPSLGLRNNSEDVLNWNIGRKHTPSYGAKNDILDRDTCPEKLVFVSHNGLFDTYHLFMSSSDALETVKSELKSYYRDKKYTDIYVGDLVATSNNNGDNVVQITEKKCQCTGSGVTFQYNINSKLTRPRIKITVGNKSNDETIQNWSSSTKTAYSAYTAVDDISQNNSCPAHGIYVNSFTGDNIFLSDDKNLSNIEKSIRKKYPSLNKLWILDCTDGQSVIVDEEENSAVITDPDYEWPSVNDNVVDTGTGNFNTYSCGEGFITDIPVQIPKATRIIYLLIEVVVPIALIILGMLDLMKAVSAHKEDEIKKGQQTFIKRLIAAAIVFFSLAIVKLAVGIVKSDSTPIIDCMNCFLQGEDHCD